VPPPAGVRTDLEMLSALAERLGQGRHFPHQDARGVFDELRRASAGGLADYSGITYERIVAEHGVFWPCPAEDHPGTPRLFLDGFPTPDGRARFTAVNYRVAAEEPSEEYPLYLTTGRVAEHYQSGTQTRRVRSLQTARPGGFAEIHPDLAATLGIIDGEMVSVTTARGSARVCARLSPDIRRDTLFIPFHWGGAARANLLTNPALDPKSKMPEFKVCSARLEKIQNVLT